MGGYNNNNDTNNCQSLAQLSPSLFEVHDHYTIYTKKYSSPNILILTRWAHHTHARAAWNSGTSTATSPWSCLSLITPGSVLGSRKKVVTVSLSPCRAAIRGGNRWGLGASMINMCWRVVARWGWRALHSPERR